MAKSDPPREPHIVLHQSGKHYPCELRGIFKGTLHIICRQPVLPIGNLTVSFGETMIAGTLQYCRPVNGRFLVCISVESSPEVRRRDPRLLVNWSCLLAVLDEGQSVNLQAVITDMSASGMGLRMNQRLEVGTMLCVHTEDFVAAGQVLHCRYLEDDDVAVGIEVTDMLWTEKMFVTPIGQKARNWVKHLWRIMIGKRGNEDNDERKSLLIAMR